MVDDILTREVKKAEFLVGDIFDINPSKAYSGLSDGDIIEESGTVPFVTTTVSDNGWKGTTNMKPLNNGNCLTYSDTTTSDAIFYQPLPYVGRSHVQHMEPRGKRFNQYIGLYVIESIKKAAGELYSYGFKFNRDRMNDTPITLPVTEDGTPDWDYMNDYMIAIQKKHLDQVEAYNKRNELILKKAHPELDTQGGLEEPEGGFREFLIGEEFDLTSTNSGIDKNKILYGDNNLVPYVTRSEFNNGIAMMIPKEQNAKYEVNRGNCIAIGLDTQTATYQETEFHTGQNVHVLRHPKMQKTNAQYIVENLKKVMQKFNWGGNGATLGRLREETITLPATKDGTPDWGYMESFMNVVFERERESQRLHHRKEEAILRKLTALRS